MIEDSGKFDSPHRWDGPDTIYINGLEMYRVKKNKVLWIMSDGEIVRYDVLIDLVEKTIP